MKNTGQANPFDGMAQFYDGWFETPLGELTVGLERDLFLRMVDPHRGERALEVGVGTGYFARFLRDAGLDVTGLDPSWPMIRLAAAKQLPVVIGDAVSLPMRSARFDVVVTNTALEFVAKPRRAVAEMYRACRPGGRIVVGALNRWSPWARRKEPPYDQAHLFSPPELLGLLSRFGRARWSTTVFYLPDGRLAQHAGRLERLRFLLRPFGAFLVVRIDT